MKTSPAHFSLACLAAGTLASHAVTVSVNSHLASTNVGGTVVAVSTGSSVQALLNGGSINAATSALAQNNLGGGSWEFVGNSTPAALSATRGNSGANTVIAGTGSLAYQIRFDLGVGESANLAFDFNYSLIEAGFNGVIVWNLTGPNGAIAAISGNVGNAASTSQNLANQSIATQLASISSPGTYTFDLTASVPAVNPKSSSVDLTFNSIDFSIQSVPETGPAALGAIGLLLLLQRNRRNRA